MGMVRGGTYSRAQKEMGCILDALGIQRKRKAVHMGFASLVDALEILFEGYGWVAWSKESGSLGKAPASFPNKG